MNLTLEQAYLAALTAVSGVLVIVAKLLWNEALECKEDRKVMREEMDELREEVGLSAGRLQALDHCPKPSCPFKQTLPAGQVAAVAGMLAALCLFPSCATAPSSGISLGWEGDLAGVPVRASYKGGKASVIVDRRVNPTK